MKAITSSERQSASFLFGKKSILILVSFLAFQFVSGQINWSLVNPYGIQLDESGTNWHAGKVVDVLVNKGGGVLAASEKSGVWLITDTYNAISLSRDWNNPDVQCLAFGPDNENHIYAGCSKSTFGENLPVLYMTDISKRVPLLYTWKTIPVPAEVGSIHQIAVLAKARQIVLACDGGIYWSAIPRANGNYEWNKASGLPDGSFFGVAVGPKNTIVASVYHPNISTGLYGIYRGGWDLQRAGLGNMSMKLVFNRAAISGFDAATMGRTSVAAAESNPEKMYALSVDGVGTPNAILRSVDGGKNWTRQAGNVDCRWPNVVMNISNIQVTGNNGAGGEIHRISVSKTNPDLIAFGLLYAYYSNDGGSNWGLVGGCDWRLVPGLHADVHTIYFDNANRMLVASDGGIAVSGDGGKTISSKYNQKLANLQWYSTFVARNFYGRFDVSYQVPGLLGGGLQDNGNVYSLVEPVATPWKSLDGGDGGAGMFIRTGAYLRANMNSGIMWYSTWDAGTKSLIGNSELPLRDPRNLTWVFKQQGLQCDVVSSPQFRNAAGQLMYMVGAQSGRLYGLFANPNGSDPHWEMVASWIIPDGSIDAVASATGKQIFVGASGANGAQIWRIAPSQEKLSEVGDGMGSGINTGKVELLGTMPSETQPAAGSDPNKVRITRIFVESDKVAYALCNSYETWKGVALRTGNGGVSWQKMPGLPDEAFFALETDWTVSPNTVFICTDKAVYRSTNSGSSWEVTTLGLPRRPHCADLSFVVNPDGKRYLYLSTYGWSVWRTAIP